MKIYCFDDETKVGKDVVGWARMRGWQAQLFNKPAEIPREPGYVLVWPSADPPSVERDKATYRQLVHLRPELTRLQSMTTMAVHDDKISQATRWSPRWMPKTYVSMSAPRAHDAMHMLKLPFISKASSGHDGEYVRAILTESNALLEIAKVFGTREGIPGKVLQRDYLLWQVLLTGNPFTYRVIRIGKYHAVQRRYRESPANFCTLLTEPVNELDGEANDVLWRAGQFLDDVGTHLCAVDIAFGGADWYVLGITLSWSISELYDCVFYGPKEHYKGKDMWILLLDEIQNGVFDGSTP